MKNIQKEFSHILNIPHEDIKTCKKLGGLTNENYLIRTKNGDFIYRKGGKANSFINRSDEFYNLKQIEGKNLDAKMLYFDEKSGDKISKYLNGFKEAKKSDFLDEKFIKKMAKKIAYLHDLDVKFASKFDFLKECEKYKKILSSHKVKLHEAFFQNEKEFLHLYKETQTTFCPCHNDLVLENILHEGENIFIIDWEYSSMNNPAWDLATIFHETEIKEDLQDYFLKIYLHERKIDLYLEKLKKEILIQHKAKNLVNYLWAMVKSIKDESFIKYANAQLHSK